MSRTNELRKLIVERLSNVCERVYYEAAKKDALYPHIVYGLTSIDLNDESREDYILEVDIWDKSESAIAIEDLADSVVNELRFKNIPTEQILPTFYTISRNTIADEDKLIRHKLIRIQVQTYER